MAEELNYRKSEEESRGCLVINLGLYYRDKIRLRWNCELLLAPTNKRSDNNIQIIHIAILMYPNPLVPI